MNRYDQRMQELHRRFVGAHRGYEPIQLTEEEIQHVEETLGTSLPTDYREFVRNYGNYWVDAIFPLKDNSDNVSPGGVGKFFGIVGKRHEDLKRPWGLTDIVDSYRGLYGEEGWPQEWLPIASGDGSDFYVMEFKGENKGAIHYIADASLEPTFLIANSFEEFMQGIVPLSDQEEE